MPIGESGLADRSEELEELSEQDLRLRLYQAMVEIADNEPGIVHRLCRAIASVMSDFCAFYLPRGAGQDVDLIAAHDVNTTLDTYIHDILRTNRIVTPQMIEAAIQRGEGTFASDLDAPLTFYEEDVVSPVVHCLIVVPLKSPRGTVFGALAVGRHSTRVTFNEVDHALLEWIGSHVAMKLETARLYRALRRTNRELSRKNAELAGAIDIRDKFLATASHELKTPLSTLNLQIALLRKEVTDPAAAARVEATAGQVDRLTRLVNQLLDVSQLVEGRVRMQCEQLDLHELVLDVVERFGPSCEQSGSTVVVDGESVVGEWDVFMLDQLASNLISNAIKYGEGGPIEVHVHAEGDEATLSVCDSGHGIAPDDQSRIFERFERASRTETPGVGLGLWIVAEIVERFHGSIEVESVVGDGTTFCVKLPRKLTSG